MQSGQKQVVLGKGEKERRERRKEKRKIVDFQVKVGDTVKKGQTVAIIEAMKLENEVASEFEGTVKEIKVAKGAIVQNQEVIIVLG